MRWWYIDFIQEIAESIDRLDDVTGQQLHDSTTGWPPSHLWMQNSPAQLSIDNRLVQTLIIHFAIVRQCSKDLLISDAISQQWFLQTFVSFRHLKQHLICWWFATKHCPEIDQKPAAYALLVERALHKCKHFVRMKRFYVHGCASALSWTSKVNCVFALRRCSSDKQTNSVRIVGLHQLLNQSNVALCLVQHKHSPFVVNLQKEVVQKIINHCLLAMLNAANSKRLYQLYVKLIRQLLQINHDLRPLVGNNEWWVRDYYVYRGRLLIAAG